MYRFIELTLNTRQLKLFSFLKDSPTRTLKNGDYYLLQYIEPLGLSMTTFSYKGVMVKVIDDDLTQHYLENGWTLARDYVPILAPESLLEVLGDLEGNRLEKSRTGQPLALSGWLWDKVVNGIATKEETAQLIRLVFIHGYDFEQLADLFSALCRRKDLAGYFIQQATRIYKGVEFG